MLHTAVVPSLPASAVTHTVSGNFSGTPDELHSEVLVVRQNHLTLYSSEKGTDGAPLTFLTEVALNAPPLSVATCKSGNAKRDIIVMLFDDFHVSFVQYNPVTVALDTVALVQLDDRESLMERCPLDAILRVDPSGTFVAVLSKRKELFFFPVGNTVSTANAQAQLSVGHGVNQSGKARVEAKATVALDAWGDEDDEEEEVAKSKNAEATEKEAKPGGAVLSVNDDVLMIGHITHLTLSDLKSTLRNIRDFQFVDSAGEPLIAFLYEKQPTWAGRVKLLQLRRRTIESNMLTCSIIWVKVTFASSSNPKLLAIGDVESLPFNVTHITPVPAFLEVPSAVLCFGRNTLLHVSTKNGYGAYFNTNGRDEVINSRYPAMVYELMSWANKSQEESLELIRTNLNFANCVAIPEVSAIGMRLLVITEEVGTVLEVTVRTDGYAVSGFSSKIIMAGCFAACWSSVGSGRYFLGSTVGDSHVITYGHDGALAVVQSFVGLCPINDVTIIDNRSLTGQEDHRLHESLENSPFADLYHNITLDPEPVRPLAERRAVQELVVCSGHGSNGAVSVLRNSIRNNIIRSEEVNAISVFFLESSNARQARDRKRTRDAGTAVMPSPSAGAAAAHLLMTGHNFTILFAVRSDSVQQIRGTALNTATRTVFATELDWAAALLQVTESQLRIVSTDRNQAIQQQDFATTVEGGSQARTAFLMPQQKSLCVLFTNGQLVQFAMEDPARAPAATVLFEKGVSAATLWAARDVIVAIEGMHLVFVNVTTRHTETQYPNFAVLPPVALAGVETPLTKLSDRPHEDPLPEVTHVEIFDHPHTNKMMKVVASFVMITSSGELLTYKVHQQDVNGPQRLIKGVNHFLDHKPEREAIETVEEKKARIAQERAFLEYDTVRARQCSDRLIPFKGIGGCDGVYACGLKPIFLTYDEQRNELVATRHQVPAAVRGFSPFNSRHVEGGYVYCCEGYVNFATMQHTGTSLGNGWWMHRVPLGVTPHKVAFNAATRHCYVVTSTMAPFSPKKASFDVQLLIKYEEDGTKSVTVEQPISFPPLSAASGARVPLNERYCVKYFACGDWRCTDEYLLEENEKVLSTDCIEIPRDTSMDATPHATVAPVFALGTAFPLGEDVTTRGRLLLLASKHASGENKLRLVHSEPLKGPATAITGIQGNIVVAVGGTISVFRFDSQASKLETLALLYAGSYVTSITAFRDYIVYGDLYHSTSFLRFRSASHTLSVLGKDVNNFSVVHTDMLYHERSFGIIASDDDRNLAVLGYTPRVQAEGTKPKKILESLLSLEGEYRIPGGSLVKMLRLRSMNKTAATGVYVTNYGEVGFLVPLSEQVNRTGQWVARRLQADIPLLAGLPPRQFLGFKQDDSKYSLRGKEKLLHAPLINELFRLDTRTRKAVAKAALTQIDRAMNVGVTIYQETCLF